MKLPKRLTKDEFLELVQSMGEAGNKDAQKIAYAALVEGRKLIDIAAEFGVSSPWVMQCRDTYYDRYLRLHQIPPGWVKATIIAPEDKLKAFLREVEQERRRLSKQE